MNIHLLTAGLLLAATLHTLPTHAEDIYKWVNENNEVQYTQMPPPAGIKAIRIQRAAPPPATGTADIVPADTAESADEAQAASQAEREDGSSGPTAEERKAALVRSRQENCSKARSNLESLNRGQVRFRSADGTVFRLTEEERQQKIRETNAQIELFCEN